MSDTEHVVFIKVDLGLDYKSTKEAIGNILASGSLCVDRELMKERYPNLRSGNIQVISGPGEVIPDNSTGKLF